MTSKLSGRNAVGRRGRRGLASGLFGRQHLVLEHRLDQLLHVPPPNKPGSRPLLEPKNVLYSESNFLDIARIWT